MRNYRSYPDENETEERVQVTHAFCNTEEEIAEAIERSKRDLKRSNVPYGYQKLDEEIITTVYKVPDNEVTNNTNLRKYNKYINNENSYTNTTQINGGKIENFCENEISKDGQYLVSMTLSKKVMDDGKGKGSGIYKSNYYKQEMEINENGENVYNENPFKINNNNQRIKKPFYSFGNNYYERNVDFNRNKYYPIRSERKVTRFYNDENYVGDEEDEKERDFKEVTNTETQSMQFPAKYKKGEFNYYHY